MTDSGLTTDVDVLVVGAGQAGLAAGMALRQTGLGFMIVDAAGQPGGSWPRYYDKNPMSDTPSALWDARFASVLVPGPATPPGRLNLMLPARDGEALIDGCLPVAVMVGEDAR